MQYSSTFRRTPEGTTRFARVVHAQACSRGEYLAALLDLAEAWWEGQKSPDHAPYVVRVAHLPPLDERETATRYFLNLD